MVFRPEDFNNTTGETISKSSGLADFLKVFFFTEQEEKATSRRHGILLAYTDSKGYEAEKTEGKTGPRASETANVFFSDAKVPGHFSGQNKRDIKIMRSELHVA